MYSIDALVIGGGPAGSATAITLAERGRVVLVVERSDFAGVRIGETLPPEANPLLSRLGILEALELDGHLRCPGSASAWGGTEVYRNDSLFDPDGDGWHLDRSRFDALLARQAAQAGAAIVVNAEILSCRRDGQWWLVEVGVGGRTEPLRARVLIDAAGRSRWPGRPSHRYPIDLQVAVMGMFRVVPGSTLDRRTWTESVRDGWWYVSALPGDQLVAAYFTDTDLLHAPRQLRQHRWDALLAETRGTRALLTGGIRSGELRIVAASSGIASPLVGDAWLAVGDAACTIDPLSSQGICWAITSGVEAAEAILDPEPDRAAERYAAGVSQRYHEYLETRRQYYSLERRWPDSPFWLRRTRSPATTTSTVGTNRGHPSDHPVGSPDALPSNPLASYL